MKKRFFKRMPSFVVASLMVLNVFIALSQESLAGLSVTVRAVTSYSNFSNIPCGEISTMSLSYKQLAK